MPTLNDVEQTMSRKDYQRLLAKRRQRWNRRRRARLRRLRMVKSLRSLEFWSRAGVVFIAAVCVAFWARFAVVYDIPSYASHALPAHVLAYVTVKPWWFGPPAFDIGQYGTVSPDIASATIGDPYRYLILHMGKYEAVLDHPKFVWILRS